MSACRLRLRDLAKHFGPFACERGLLSCAESAPQTSPGAACCLTFRRRVWGYVAPSLAVDRTIALERKSVSHSRFVHVDRVRERARRDLPLFHALATGSARYWPALYL